MTYKNVDCSGPVLQILDSLPDEPEKGEPDTVGSQGSSAHYVSRIFPRQTVVMLRCACVWVSWRVDKHTFIYLFKSQCFPILFSLCAFYADDDARTYMCECNVRCYVASSALAQRKLTAVSGPR